MPNKNITKYTTAMEQTIHNRICHHSVKPQKIAIPMPIIQPISANMICSFIVFDYIKRYVSSMGVR